MGPGRAIAAATALVAALTGLCAAAPASPASFHLIKISEVFPGTPAAFDKAFIELQMYAAGQNQVAGHSVVVYNAAGTVTATVPMTTGVALGDNQRRILLGDIDVTNRDFEANVGTLIVPSGGAVCLPDSSPPDCVSWGNFTGNAALPAPGAGTPVLPAGIPAAGTTASSITRTITPGCPTLLEALDDTDNSLTDFVETPEETPQNNASNPPEIACSSGLDTSIVKKPKRRTAKTTAKFKFESTDPAATFECKLDKRAFKPCSSPKKYRRLDGGRHRFKVRAIDALGTPDPTPAKARFKIVA